MEENCCTLKLIVDVQEKCNAMSMSNSVGHWVNQHKAIKENKEWQTQNEKERIVEHLNTFK